MAGAAFAGPNSGSPGPSKKNTPAVQKAKSSGSSSANPKKLPKFTPNGASASSPKKFNPPTQLTKFKSPNKTANYNLKHGKSFAYGTYYPGRYHRQWSAYGWSSQYGAYLYLDPATNGYYYWSAADQNYYPVAYADVVAPTANAPLVDNDLTDSPEAPTPSASGPVMPVGYPGVAVE